MARALPTLGDQRIAGTSRYFRETHRI